MSIELSEHRAGVIRSLGEKVDGQTEAAMGRLRTVEGSQLAYKRASSCIHAHMAKRLDTLVDELGADGCKLIRDELLHAVGLMESLHDGANVERIKAIGALDAYMRVSAILTKEWDNEQATISRLVAFAAGEARSRPPGAKPAKSKTKARRTAAKKKAEAASDG